MAGKTACLVSFQHSSCKKLYAWVTAIYIFSQMAIQDLCCLCSHSHKNSLCPQWSIFVIKIVDFICFIMCSKSTHWHVHIYIQQTHVYYDGYNKTMDNTRCKHDSNNYFKVHQCHCFYRLWFFKYFFWLMLVRLQRSNFFLMQVYINMQTLYLHLWPVMSYLSRIFLSFSS